MENERNGAAGAPRPYLTTNAAAPALWEMGILWTMLATGDQTAGQYTLIEELLPKDAGAPPHIHAWQDEGFYVIEGDIAFRAGDRILRAGAGSFVAIPKGAVHNFRVDSATARVLNFYAPAALDRAIMTGGTPATTRTLPPADIPSMGQGGQGQHELAAQVLEHYTQKVADTPDLLRPRAENRPNGDTGS